MKKLHNKPKNKNGSYLDWNASKTNPAGHIRSSIKARKHTHKKTK